MDAFNNALLRAGRGLDWSYPCLIWVADFLLEATGDDYAADWRQVEWTEDTAKREMARLAVGGRGASAVERCLDALAHRHGWDECDGGRQGAVMVGVYTDPDGVGFPAIFDGWKGWLVAMFGNATIVREPPERMWEIVS